MAKKPRFKAVEKLMLERGISTLQLSKITGIEMHTLYKRLNGAREIKLYEAILIKTSLKTDMPLEKLFEE